MTREWDFSIFVWTIQRNSYRGMFHFLFEVHRYWLRKDSLGGETEMAEKKPKGVVEMELKENSVKEEALSKEVRE